MTHFQTTINVPGLVQKRAVEKVVFTPEGVTIEKSFGFIHKTFIADKDIAAFRFGVKELRGLKFSFGRQYFIEVKDWHNKISRIKLNSIYGINRKLYYKVWADLLQNVWDFYMENQLNYYTELYNIQQMFDLAGVTFHPDGITWNKKTDVLPWNKIAIKSYHNYFMIHHVDDLTQHKYCIFSIDWNAVVLQSLLKDIVKQHSRVTRTLRKGR